MILVTGGTGLSGSFVVQELAHRGHEVKVMARSQTPDSNEIRGVTRVFGDLNEHQSLRDACREVDGIVHTACTFTDSNIDIAAMQVLIDNWKRGPFVFFSSLDVYGLSNTAFITEEETLDETYSDYAKGKVVCERMLTDTASKQGRSDYTILRAPYIWAPHLTAYRRLMERLDGRITIVLPGASEEEWSQYRDAWIDARDLAWIVAEYVQQPLGGAVNVLSDHFVWTDLFVHLINLTGSNSLIIHKPLSDIREEELANKQLYAKKWQFSDRRLRDTLGYQPTRTWQETLTEVFATR